MVSQGADGMENHVTTEGGFIEDMPFEAKHVCVCDTIICTVLFDSIHWQSFSGPDCCCCCDLILFACAKILPVLLCLELLRLVLLHGDNDVADEHHVCHDGGETASVTRIACLPLRD